MQLAGARSLGLLGLVVLFACEGDARSNEAIRLENQLKTCGLIDNGKFSVPVGDSDVARCLVACAADANCEELREHYCELKPQNAVSACRARCLTGFSCDGGSKTYTILERCNGTTDCFDGSDESGCPRRDGVTTFPEFCESDPTQVLRPYQICDEVYDCVDGTDERDCPYQDAPFTCKTRVDGFVLQIPASHVCNMVRECPDGSDETDCAKFTCERR